MKKVKAFTNCMALIVLVSLTFTQSALARVPDAGIYNIWSPKLYDFASVKGGQVMVQWGQLQNGPGSNNANFDWSVLDDEVAVQLGDLDNATTGRKVSIQVNGNIKPDFLYNQVTWVTEGGSWSEGQVNDGKILMYWHDTFIEEYRTFIQKLAAHLRSASYKNDIVGVRMNWDAIGTEQLDVPSTINQDDGASHKYSYQDKQAWVYPAGVTGGSNWSSSVIDDYEKQIMDKFYSSFIISGSPYLFARANMEDSVYNGNIPGSSTVTYQDKIDDGTLGLLSTINKPEPSTIHDVNLIEKFYDHARPGGSKGYAESFGDAWGSARVGTPDFFMPPTQANYWRILQSLNAGVSYIAIYGSDLNVAVNKVHDGKTLTDTYQNQFTKAFQFGAKYAGYHADPSGSPGAWIAFRVSQTAISNTTYDSDVTDYNMHLTLLNPGSTVGLDARGSEGSDVPYDPNNGLTDPNQRSIGPYTQRFGAWARKLASGNTMQLKLNDSFLTSINNSSSQNKQIEITYLDQGNGSFVTKFTGNSSVTTNLTDSGNWKTEIINIPAATNLASNLGASGNATFTIKANGSAVIFHMVEVVKDSSAN